MSSRKPLNSTGPNPEVIRAPGAEGPHISQGKGPWESPGGEVGISWFEEDCDFVSQLCEQRTFLELAIF